MMQSISISDDARRSNQWELEIFQMIYLQY